jgi:hypothetical protein
VVGRHALYLDWRRRGKLIIVPRRETSGQDACAAGTPKTYSQRHQQLPAGLTHTSLTDMRRYHPNKTIFPLAIATSAPMVATETSINPSNGIGESATPRMASTVTSN